MAESIEEILERSECDAMQFGIRDVSVVDGHCTCLICARCGHHTGNAMFGHHGYSCKVLIHQAAERRKAGETFTMQEFIQAGTRDEPHFCCPDDEHGCEIEQREKASAGSSQPEPT